MSPDRQGFTFVRQTRRSQQHRNQQPTRRKPAALSSAPGRKADVPFPMSLFQNTTAFVVVGLFIMIGGLLFVSISSFNLGGGGQDALDRQPTNTPSVSETADASTPQDDSGTPVPTRPANLQFASPERVIDPVAFDYRATIETARGNIVIDLYDDISPDTVNSLAFLAQQGYFNGITFHRVFKDANLSIIQGGDPTGTGSGGPGYLVDEEPNELLNTRGTIAMAKTSGATAFGSQFFFNLINNTALDVPGNRFYPFGEIVEGIEVADQIAQGDGIVTITIEAIPDPDAPPASSTPEGGAAGDETPGDDTGSGDDATATAAGSGSDADGTDTPTPPAGDDESEPTTAPDGDGGSGGSDG
jgi:cyclophilin family peptidyl-prolyl cis-trans isomerase